MPKDFVTLPETAIVAAPAPIVDAPFGAVAQAAYDRKARTLRAQAFRALLDAALSKPKAHNKPGADL